MSAPDKRILLLLCAILLNACAESSQEERTTFDHSVVIPAGCFVMGSNEAYAASKPAHRVYLSAYVIDRFEVTHQEYAEYVEATGNYPRAWQGNLPAMPANQPVTGILWDEAHQYCSWRGMRLPTEAEWEKAARGAAALFYPWGNKWDADLANTQESGIGAPVEVDAYPGGQSPYGLFNMVGNVQEWVSDYYDPEYYEFSPSWDPRGPDRVLDHVLRGGSWDSPREHANAIFRNSSHSVLPNERVGFRCARSID